MGLTRLQRENRDFERMIPQIKNVARYFWAHKAPARLRRRFEFSDFLEEVVAHCFVAYRRLLDSGKSGSAFATPLATYACKQLASGRTSTSATTTDALWHDCELHPDLRNVERFKPIRPALHIEPVENQRDSQQNVRDKSRARWQDMLTPSGRLNPADGAALLLDVASFLRLLTSFKRRILKALADGNTPTAVALMFDLTPGRIVQIRKECLAIWDALNPPDKHR